MRKFTCLGSVALFAAVALASVPFAASAAGPTIVAQVNGGGTGLFVNPSVTPTDIGLFTNFGVGLTAYSDGSAKGHFTCVVPGYVVVEGYYDSATSNPETGIVTASGVALNIFPKGVSGMENTAEIYIVNFTNTFEAGGPGVGMFTLTDDSGFFDVAPFLDTEVVVKGKITIK